MRKKKHWSYNTGEKGRNWVRAYRDGRDGTLYLEYFETVGDVDPVTGEDVLKKRKRRVLLPGVNDTRVAEKRARRLAEKFAAMADAGGAAVTAPVSLARLIHRYTQEVTPLKRSESKRSHDLRAARVFLAYFDGQRDKARRSSRLPASLDRLDWDGFVAARRAGSIDGWQPVRDRQVEYDLTFLVSVLNWATGTKDAGVPLLDRNPWGRETRAAQGWVKPKERSPHRPPMPEDIRELLIEAAPSWQFGAALRLERQTRRRNSALRQLLWSDIDLTEGRETVQWRGESDKARRSNVTPLLPAAVAVLKSMPRGIGDTPLFPSATDPSQPTPRNTWQIWLRRAKARVLRNIADLQEREAMRGRLRGVGFHSEKRNGVRDPEFRRLAPAVQEAIAGTDFDTMRKVYDHVTLEDMRDAMRGMRPATELPADLTAGG